MIGLVCCAGFSLVFGNDEVSEVSSWRERHADGSDKVADEQDELAADVQQLVMEQTVAQVIELLSEVEGIMDESIDYLSERETGGRTIAAQTEIIEKIHAAAKAKQGSSGSSKEGSAMMDMMERMMGMKPDGEQEGEGEGESEGEGEGEGGKAGQGEGGDSDSANAGVGGTGDNGVEVRRVPKAGGTAGRSLPSEFQEALEAYNRGLEP